MAWSWLSPHQGQHSRRTSTGSEPCAHRQKIDHTSWVGRSAAAILTIRSRTARTTQEAEHRRHDRIVGEKIPAKLYVSEDKKLAIGIEDKVTRPQQLLLQMSRDLASYYPIEAGQMNDIATKGRPAWGKTTASAQAASARRCSPPGGRLVPVRFAIAFAS